ncbi:MAG: hypothetical protein GIX01_02580 [Candidatus Eremiobacteraeota bacterium]|nr:hypothetical protein [Candidatus Eremiobacteraeota bacterium]
MLERLRNNAGLKLLSLAIAVIAWSYLRFTPNPVIATARFTESITVPIVATGLAAGEIAHLGAREATLTVDVPREGGTVSPQLVRAILDLAGRGPGTYNVPVQVVAPKFEVKSLSPTSITLTIERVEERSVPIAVRYTDRNRNVVVTGVQVAPLAATLRAPTSSLVRVAGVVVKVPLPAAPGTFDAMLRPLPIDARGSAVAGITLDPNLVRVRAVFARGSR